MIRVIVGVSVRPYFTEEDFVEWFRKNNDMLYYALQDFFDVDYVDYEIQN